MPSIATFSAQLSNQNGAGSLAASLPLQFTIASAGPFPLAKHVPVPGDPVGGALMIAFENFTFGPVTVSAIAPGAPGSEEQGEVTVTLAPAQVQGHYTLFALKAPRIDLDTGGAAQPFAAVDTLAAPPADPGPPGITEKQYDQVTQANSQRTILNQTANGRAMLSAYDTYNDDYNNAFNTNASLRRAWVADGAVAAMSDHTSNALDTGTIINPSDQKFGTKGNTYNANAFAQQLNVWAACVKNAPDAAKAALKFGDPVGTTGNTKVQITPMTGDQVFGSVDNASPDLLTASLLPEPDAHPVHATLMQVAQNTHTDAHLDALAARGIALTPDDVTSVQAVYAESLRVDDPGERLPVAQGNCALALAETTFRFRLVQQPDGAITVKLVQTTLSLDGLDYGAAQWLGPAGDVARERLDSSAFLRGILEDRLTSQLTRQVRRMAALSA